MPTLPPTNGSGRQTAHALRTSDKGSKEFVADQHKEMLFVLPNFTAAADLVSMGAGVADLDEVAGIEIVGVDCTTNESYTTLWKLPDEIDVAQSIDFRVLCCDEAAASTDVQTAVITYQAVTVGTDALVAPATALNTVIVAQADLAANIPWWTSYGSIAANTIVDAPGEDLCNVKILWTLSTLVQIWTLGCQVRYFRKYVG
jgi:hypothetical protein